MARSILAVSLYCIMMMLCSCQKIYNIYVIKGEWEVVSVEINGGSTNMMETFLPYYYYKNNCCSYKIYFDDDGTAKAEYHTFDTLNYEMFGEWELKDDKHIYMHLDEYVDGVFEIEIVNANEMNMYAEENLIKAYNIGMVGLIIRARRN